MKIKHKHSHGTNQDVLHIIRVLYHKHGQGGAIFCQITIYRIKKCIYCWFEQYARALMITICTENI